MAALSEKRFACAVCEGRFAEREMHCLFREGRGIRVCPPCYIAKTWVWSQGKRRG